MDWVLPDPAKHVSSHHFDIQFANGAYWLRDVSTNGTFLQGSRYRIEGMQQLRGGERLVVGHYVIAVEMAGQQAAVPLASPQGATQDPWSTMSDDADPWDLGPQPLQPVNPLPPPRMSPHHFDDMAQDFMPLQQPPRAEPPPQAVEPSARPGEPKAVPMPSLHPQERPPAAQAAPRPQPAQPLQTTPVVSEDAFRQEIIAAFCRGAGVAPETLQEVDLVQLVEAMGKSTRVTVDEMMQMLQDRASVKQFTRGGERTMRSATGNNPMKFLPDAEQAFVALFLEPRQGFMQGAEGFENALRDLRQHQKAVFAALQPALADVLTGLSPDEIEDRDGKTGNLLAGSKRGRHWDAFVQRWDEKASGGDHGMLDVFLRAFAKAYAEAAVKPD
ncbi:Type VI secretion system FHA domain protein [Sulfitobacter noctilucae]|nr:Type VI secretion system FHA domain protein [Sulfitobacter noctilucae]